MITWRKSAKRFYMAAIVCGLMVMFSGIGMADLRIVTESDGTQMTVYMQNNRIALPFDDEAKIIIECRTEQLTVVGNGRYWHGAMDEFINASELGAALEEEVPADIIGFLGNLFGGGAKKEKPQVRITKVGNETVGGYDAVHYKVETGSGDRWKTFEELWLSSALLQQIAAEVGECHSKMSEIGNELTALLPFGADELVAVVNDPAYLQLFQEGYPVKSVSNITVFGFTSQLVDTVVEVSGEAVPASVFAVPDHYTRTDDPWSIVM